VGGNIEHITTSCLEPEAPLVSRDFHLYIEDLSEISKEIEWLFVFAASFLLLASLVKGYISHIPM